jgi:hypothetical protein
VNCGSLEALGTDNVRFKYPYRGWHVTFTLCGCLYAPAAPINLLSVGVLVKCGMSHLFSPGGIMKVFFPDGHFALPGFKFTAKVSNCLSFLKLDFLQVISAVPPTALPAPVPAAQSHSSDYSFPRLKLDSILWHCHFGHIGMEATQAALTKNYVTSVQFEL